MTVLSMFAIVTFVATMLHRREYKYNCSSQLKKVKTIDVFLGQISHIGLRLTVLSTFSNCHKSNRPLPNDGNNFHAKKAKKKKTAHTNLTDNFAFLNQTGM